MEGKRSLLVDEVAERSNRHSDFNFHGQNLAGLIVRSGVAEAI
jgi:hypothetical protein